MKNGFGRGNPWQWGWLLISVLCLPLALYAGKNRVMGHIRFEGRSGIERDSGVWVDGQYVGFLKELKGSQSILLLPGEHTVSVRQNGYQEFNQRVQIQPGQTEVVKVVMAKGARVALPPVMATLKVAVNPSRAAVFVDGLYIGHVSEFDGRGRGMLVAPGAHQIKIALPGYQVFQTEINAVAYQKVEIKTNLLKGGGPLAAPLVNTETSPATAPSARDTGMARAR